MATRAELMQRLSMLPTHELLHLLRDETIVEIAARYFDASLPPNLMQPLNPIPMPETPTQTKSYACDKAKRPLNAFMAFRSYYLKMFPDVQQKTASGFLTTLWNKDPFRNKWALIAKVYSFVRDEIGKDKVSLAYFLGFSCPVMGIVEPHVYLAVLGWSVQGTEGSQRLVQDQATAALGQSQLQNGEFPTTELELLTALVNVGYLPEQGIDLMEKLGANSSAIMATSNPRLSLPVSYTPEKLHFMSTIRSDPVQATKELFGDAYDEYTIQLLGIKSHDVEDLDSISHIQLQTELPDPRYYYSYATSNSQVDLNGLPVMTFEGIPEHESFDIDSPWDVDTILGQSQPEGQRTAIYPTSPRHDVQEDFHYTFG
uniref:MAT1-1-1 n=2 Tax=Ustilaginoidea virens TaxID=1159556 RepID=A0A0K0MJJ9_USTVR|nr:MAT1-1-1 [Ustilaginoidea virens]AKE48507.1 MAT1-1-1 [Ustilaginoidea virens]